MSQNVSHSYCTAEKLTATCFRDPVYCKVLRQDINFTSASAVVPCCGQRCLQRLLLWFAITINTPNLLWLEETSDACNYAPEIALCMYVCTYTLIAQKRKLFTKVVCRNWHSYAPFRKCPASTSNEATCTVINSSKSHSVVTEQLGALREMTQLRVI
uniref:Uncharacterized protein n=1 Tax=Rhipicephalus microplus TaxID=6941 RepID=A0A6G5AFL9_RHIMP